MTDTEAQMKGIGARNEAAKRGAYPGDIHAGFLLLRRDIEFLIEQNRELRLDKERLDWLLNECDMEQFGNIYDRLSLDAAKEKH